MGVSDPPDIKVAQASAARPENLRAFATSGSLPPVANESGSLPRTSKVEVLASFGNTAFGASLTVPAQRSDGWDRMATGGFDMNAMMPDVSGMVSSEYLKMSSQKSHQD